MTKNPKTIAPDALIAEAVNVMNNTGRGITNLFVVKGTKPVGVIHIHDCLKAGVSWLMFDSRKIDDYFNGKRQLDEIKYNNKPQTSKWLRFV